MNVRKNYFDVFTLILSLIVSIAGADDHLADKYTCSTPDQWLAIAGKVGAINNFGSINSTESVTGLAGEAISSLPGTKWPGGIVKYRLHSSLTTADINEVKAAFDEYHSKTCIRFRPWRVSDPPDYTSIELDNSICGVGHVCKVGGSQFAKFGKICRNKATMVHELGHNLCLGHEHQRSDRDRHISYDKCNWGEYPPPKLPYDVKGMYDYTSQMHYTCNWCMGGWPREKNVRRCGQQISDGLSVLDADYINELYDCKGCYRHRWRPIDKLTEEDEENLYDFGYMDINGESLYPCRAMVHGELTIGKFSRRNGMCRVPYQGEEHHFRNGARSEVLTFPGGLVHSDSQYVLLNPSVNVSMKTLLEMAVPAGRWISEDHDSDDNKNSVTTSYIAYGMLNSPIHGKSEDTIGKVWVDKNGRKFGKAYFPLGLREISEESHYRVLMCL